MKKILRQNIEITNDDLLRNVRSGMNNLYQTGNCLVKDTYFDDQDKSIIVDLCNFNILDNTECTKHNRKCICKSKITKDGYNFYCDICKAVLPNVGLYQNIPAFNNAFINYGIIVNNQQAPLTLNKTLLVYPLNVENFKDYQQMKQFEIILNTHDKEKIIKYIDIPYKYYIKSNLYLSNKKETVNENEVYDYIKTYYLELTNKLIDFYQKNTDIPFMNNMCYNSHIMINLTELYQHIQNNKNLYLPLIQKQIGIIDKSTPYDCTNDKFISYIKKGTTKHEYLILSELYDKYIKLYNSDNINCTDNVLTKNEFKNNIEKHLKDNLGLTKWAYSQYMVNYKRICGWKYVLFNKF